MDRKGWPRLRAWQDKQFRKEPLREGCFPATAIENDWLEELLEERENLQNEVASLKEECADLKRKLEPSMNRKEPSGPTPPPSWL